MKTPITPVQQRDTVLALLLVLLIAFFVTGEMGILYAMAATLVAGMTVPRLFTPAARLWFGFSHILGAIMSRVIMALLYFVLVTPVGLLRRLLRRDTLALRQWKNGAGSVFTPRDHTYTPEDLNHPY